MKRFALLPALFALLLAAVLTGAAFAQQAPPGQTLRQAGDMIPDASTIAAFAARTATADSAAQARDTLLDTVAAFADQTATTDNAAQARDTLLDTVATLSDQAATAGSTAQAGDMIPDASTVAAFIARSSTEGNTAQARDMLPDTVAAFAARSATAASLPQAGDVIPDVIAAGLTVPTDWATAQSATWESASQAEAQWQIAQRQAYGLAQGSQTAQLAPSQYDDSKRRADGGMPCRL